MALVCHQVSRDMAVRSYLTPGHILAAAWSQQRVRLVHCYHILQWPI